MIYEKANARLIAAAPDLLAACKIALEVCNYADDGRIVDPTTTKAEKMLKTAIARAEGRPL